ncbi:MAG: hypothetical protein ACTSRA_00295 [Promethearchaeota archaeon]|nr:MAG: hypothetical protein [Helarchaeota virus Nidhogg Meg22_1012]URC17394.1 MAG: hypothetical protein [Helarchaeota virus Nidhogg Meg22_1214]
MNRKAKLMLKGMNERNAKISNELMSIAIPGEHGTGIPVLHPYQRLRHWYFKKKMEQAKKLAKKYKEGTPEYRAYMDAFNVAVGKTLAAYRKSRDLTFPMMAEFEELKEKLERFACPKSGERSGYNVHAVCTESVCGDAEDVEKCRESDKYKRCTEKVGK